MEERLTKAETKLAYLEEEVRLLNEIVTKEELLVTRLEKQVQFLASKVKELDVEARPSRKPPHY